MCVNVFTSEQIPLDSTKVYVSGFRAPNVVCVIDNETLRVVPQRDVVYDRSKEPELTTLLNEKLKGHPAYVSQNQKVMIHDGQTWRPIKQHINVLVGTTLEKECTIVVRRNKKSINIKIH